MYTFFHNISLFWGMLISVARNAFLFLLATNLYHQTRHSFFVHIKGRRLLPSILNYLFLNNEFALLLQEYWNLTENGGRKGDQECACLRAAAALLSFNWKFSLTYLPLINSPWKFHVINFLEEEDDDVSITTRKTKERHS